MKDAVDVLNGIISNLRRLLAEQATENTAERALADDLAAPMDDAALRDLAVEIADWLWTPDFQLDPNANSDEINWTHQKLVEYFAGPLARYREARQRP